jgi:two-component system nitrogen regulation sensor histidine kinase NtrY
MNEFRKNSIALFIASCIGFLIAWGAYYSFLGRDFKKHVKTLEGSIHELDKKLDLFFEQFHHDFQDGDSWSNRRLLDHPKLCLIRENGRFVFWNTDLLPIQDSALLLTKTNPSFVQLSNGYYYLKKKTVGTKTILAGQRVMEKYFYENENLRTGLTSDFRIPQELTIHTHDGYPVLSPEGETLFYALPSEDDSIGVGQEFFIFICFVIALIALLIAISHWVERFALNKVLKLFLFPLLVVVVWFLSLQLNVFYFFHSFALFAPDLFAASAFFSDLGMTIIELIFLGSIGHWLLLHLSSWVKELNQQTVFSALERIITIALFAIIFPFAYFINWFVESLVVNSSISFELDNLFALSLFSYIGLFIVAILFLFYVLFSKKIAALLLQAYQPSTIAVVWFILGVVYFFVDIFIGENPFISAIWPLLINGLILFSVYRNTIKTATWALLAISLFSLYTTLNFYAFREMNEHQKRQFFADQIISDKDIGLELEFNDVITAIRQNDVIKSTISERTGLSQNLIIDELEDCCLSSFWDRYDIQLYLFDEQGNDLLNYVEGQSSSLQELNTIIAEHGEVSEIRQDLFYVTNYFNRLSYLGRINLSLNDAHRILYFAFRSKKLPEEIGIPRLLINHSPYVLDDLEKYSIARYGESELLMKYGDFNFHMTKNALLRSVGSQIGFSKYEGTSIYMRRGDHDQLLVIAKPTKTFFEQLTGFSYTFIFYLLVVVLLLILNGQFKLLDFFQLNLATKIQVVLIGLIVLSFVLFGTVTGSYVRYQYGYFSNDLLKERLHSVHIEINQKLGDKDDLEPELLGTYIEYILKKFSRVFMTDINLYDNQGKLLASSQPNLYSRGISSTLINPSAFVHILQEKKSDFIHTESIGNLNYLSAYKPFINSKNQQLGVINIKHFAKQQQYENQITGFLVAIINSAVLLLLLTIIVALIVSNWITTPLRLIQQSFKSVDIGKQNQPIDYKRNDEIGALVKDYNDKLLELELKAMQLARNERETAWREMAKQVAHEIKNPLTPMKLRLQHFQRAFDPNDPDAKEKIAKITGSLVEQIDGLTKIANEFSNFAKMPKANEQEIDLIPILQNGVDLFSEEGGTICFTTNLSEAKVWADKDLFVRVVNNILKNAYQAIPENTPPAIAVGIEEDGEHFLISFTDNGRGISEEDRYKLFVPNFTTKTTGAGLGLAMVKQIIQNHNGEIWFESELGKGTTFFVLIKRYDGSRG